MKSPFTQCMPLCLLVIATFCSFVSAQPVEANEALAANFMTLPAELLQETIEATILDPDSSYEDILKMEHTCFKMKLNVENRLESARKDPAKAFVVLRKLTDSLIFSHLDHPQDALIISKRSRAILDKVTSWSFPRLGDHMVMHDEFFPLIIHAILAVLKHMPNLVHLDIGNYGQGLVNMPHLLRSFKDAAKELGSLKALALIAREDERETVFTILRDLFSHNKDVMPALTTVHVIPDKSDGATTSLHVGLWSIDLDALPRLKTVVLHTSQDAIAKIGLRTDNNFDVDENGRVVYHVDTAGYRQQMRGQSIHLRSLDP